MSSYKRLARNSIIFLVGNIGSRVVVLLLVPLYAHYLSQSEYGRADLIATTASLLIPLVSLSVYEAVLRFAMDDTFELTEIVTNSVFLATLLMLVFLAVAAILSSLGLLIEYTGYFILLVLLQIANLLLSNFVRGIGMVKAYALNGIIHAIFTVAFSALNLAVYRMGIKGYLLSLIGASLMSSTYLVISSGIWKFVKLKLVSIKSCKVILQYSLPLMPNTLMWWLINNASRYLILIYLGSEMNGLYAVGSKVPTFIHVINMIFLQAWQLSAIEEYGKEKSSNFYSNIFKLYSRVLFGISSISFVLLKHIFFAILPHAYHNAWKAVPFLVLGAVFSSFSGFVGASYLASKRTRGSFKTSFFGATLCLILSFLVIPYLGLIGAGIAICVSFFAMFILRLLDTKKDIDIRINWKRFFLCCAVLLIQIVFMFTVKNLMIETVLSMSMTLILLYSCRDSWSNLKHYFFRKRVP